MQKGVWNFGLLSKLTENVNGLLFTLGGIMEW